MEPEEILAKLTQAVKERRARKARYDEWHDDYYSKPISERTPEEIKRHHNMEAALRNNLGLAEQNILNLAEQLVDKLEKGGVIQMDSE